MPDRYFCYLHRKPMTGVRTVHSGQPVRRCEDCVAIARDKVRAHIAAFEAEKQFGKHVSACRTNRERV
jgi:hypothetical protein